MHVKRMLMNLSAPLVAVATALAPLGAEAAELTQVIGDLKWSCTVDGSAATITGVEHAIASNRVEGTIAVPDELGEVPVTAIGYRAFEGQEFITEVVLPSGVVTLDDSCFDGCKRLTTLTLPATARTIGASAFLDCKSLRSVTINDGLTEIKGLAFSGCTALHHVCFQGDLPTIGRYLTSSRRS